MQFEFFVTPKGTRLPVLSLKGKSYLQVAHRLVWFREEHPDWSIETELVSVDDRHSLVRAVIKTSEGRVLATATKRENKEHFLDHTEKCETGAIGRALALVGYGTQFAPDFDETYRVVDSPVDRKVTSAAFVNGGSSESVALSAVAPAIAGAVEVLGAKIVSPHRKQQTAAQAEGPALSGPPACGVCGKEMRVSQYKPEYYCPTKPKAGEKRHASVPMPPESLPKSVDSVNAELAAEDDIPF